MATSFMPDLVNTSKVNPSRWRYTPMLPLVFGMELSYMEQIAKLVQKVNEVIENDNAQNTNFAALVDAFAKWEEFLNDSSVPDGAVTTAKLADLAVTAAKIAAGAVGTDQLANGSVTMDKLAKNSVDRDHIDPGAVGTSQIGVGAIISDHFSAGAVDTAAIGDGAVTGMKIADGSITVEKLATAMANQWATFIRVVANLENGNGDFNVNTLNVINGLTLAAQCVVNCGTAILHNLGEPASDTDAATKGYVDTAVKGAEVGNLSITTEKLAGSAVTTAKVADQAITMDKLGETIQTILDDSQRLHEGIEGGNYPATFGSLTLNGNLTMAKSATVNMGGNSIVNVADPTVAQGVATKNYVDTVIVGGEW